MTQFDRGRSPLSVQIEKCAFELAEMPGMGGSGVSTVRFFKVRWL